MPCKLWWGVGWGGWAFSIWGQLGVFWRLLIFVIIIICAIQISKGSVCSSVACTFMACTYTHVHCTCMHYHYSHKITIFIAIVFFHQFYTVYFPVSFVDIIFVKMSVCCVYNSNWLLAKGQWSDWNDGLSMLWIKRVNCFVGFLLWIIMVKQGMSCTCI